jgi:hypothetical protein
MPGRKEKRGHDRITFPEVRGSIEINDRLKPVTIVNASVEGVCIAGEAVESGTVVRLSIEDEFGLGNISLYCKAAWSSEKRRQDKLTGLFLLNTNKVLFANDLSAFGRLIETVRRQQGS